MTTNCVLFYRFALAWLIMTIVMLLRKENLKVSWREFGIVSILGILFIFSSLSLYLSFHFMPAGVASTILFTYPIMTVIIMALVYHEKASIYTLLSIGLATIGVLLLYWTGEGLTLNPWGVVLVLISALSYAIYIVVVGKANLQCSSFKINWYVLLWCAIGMLIYTWIVLYVVPAHTAWQNSTGGHTCPPNNDCQYTGGASVSRTQNLHAPNSIRVWSLDGQLHQRAVGQQGHR